MIKKALKYFALCFCLTYLPIFIISAGPLTGLGGWQGSIDTFILSVIGSALLAFIIGCLFLLSSEFRSDAAAFLLSLFLVMIFFIPVIVLSSKIRSYGFYVAGIRAAPLILAVNDYKKDNGKIPSDIQELIPKYLQRTPYGIPPLKPYQKKDGTWGLLAEVSTGFLNWDEFYYKSNLDYSDCKSRSCERLGDWIYYHE